MTCEEHKWVSDGSKIILENGCHVWQLPQLWFDAIHIIFLNGIKYWGFPTLLYLWCRRLLHLIRLISFLEYQNWYLYFWYCCQISYRGWLKVFNNVTNINNSLHRRPFVPIIKFAQLQLGAYSRRIMRVFSNITRGSSLWATLHDTSENNKSSSLLLNWGKHNILTVS